MSESYLPSERVQIVVDPAKEGIIEVRSSDPRFDLGERRYAMARVRVIDGRHYVKGMVLYSALIPEEYDVVCYMGSTVRSAYRLVRTYEGKVKKSTPILDIVQVEADWSAWTGTFPRQSIAERRNEV